MKVSAKQIDIISKIKFMKINYKIRKIKLRV